MRRSAGLMMIGVLALVLPDMALAGPFGGFSGDGSRYLVDGTRVCEPVTGRLGAPLCEKKGADEVARLGFRKGALQRGTGATVQVQASGTRLQVRSSGGKTLRAEWDSGNPILAVAAVYLSESGKLVAIEYDTRLAGRTAQEVVVLALGAGGPAPVGSKAPNPPPSASAPPPAAPTGATPPATGTSPAPAAEDPKVAALVQAGDKQLGRKKWKAAEKEYRDALALASDHPAARYGLAAALAGQGKSADAVTELSALARSSHPEAPRWLVEARLGGHFARLQSDPGFRRAVGIDPDPGRQVSAYERVVGLGGRWEQTGIPCQEPTVDLRLDRKSEKFQLMILTRCQGDEETTRLSGTWQAEGTALLRLAFPNVDGPEEQLECKLVVLPGRSAEDGLSCALEDLHFTLRTVRR